MPVKEIDVIHNLETFNGHLVYDEEEADKPMEPGDDHVEKALEAVTLKVFKNDQRAYWCRGRFMTPLS